MFTVHSEIFFCLFIIKVLKVRTYTFDIFFRKKQDFETFAIELTHGTKIGIRISPQTVR
jgi:hypothetical protein